MGSINDQLVSAATLNVTVAASANATTATPTI
jgi:hypothetical protein